MMTTAFKDTAARFVSAGLALFFTTTALAAPVQATLHRNPGCMCCERYAMTLNRQGYDVRVVSDANLAAFNTSHGVSPASASCHTMRIGGYTVVGHVPEAAVARLLRERPDIQGIALPGMPAGSPGMPGDKREPFVVRTLAGQPYATY